MQQDKLDPISVFITTFSITSFAGLAALLRSGKTISIRTVMSAMLNGGLLGLGIGFLWYNYYKDNIWFLMGVCVLAGLGGVTVLDFILSVLRRGGLDITIKANEDISLTHGGSTDVPDKETNNPNS